MKHIQKGPVSKIYIKVHQIVSHSIKTYGVIDGLMDLAAALIKVYRFVDSVDGLTNLISNCCVKT